MAHTNAWDETRPAGTDFASTLDDQIRQFKLDVRERMAIDHIWNDGVNTDGRHKSLTLHPTDNTSFLSIADGSSLTGANAQSFMSFSQTWNTTGAPTFFYVNITDTASSANSHFLTFAVGGISKFRITKTGTVSLANDQIFTCDGGYLWVHGITALFLRADGTSPVHIGDITANPIGIGAGGGAVTIAAGGGAVTVTGVTTLNAASTRGLVVSSSHASGAGIQITTTAGSGTPYAITQESDGVLRIQHDVDGSPRIEVNAIADQTAFVAATGHVFHGSAVVPGTTDTYDLGSSALRWKKTYTNSVAFNSTPISASNTDLNDWNPTGLASATYISLSASFTVFNLTGIAAQEGGRLLIISCGVTNSGSYIMNFESASSTAANRIVVLASNQEPGLEITSIAMGGKTALLQYDGSISRWRFLGFLTQ